MLCIRRITNGYIVTCIQHAGITVARVYLNKLTTDAYHKCFSSMFGAVSSTYPKFKVGKSLVGIIMDWSDQQFSGLELAVGKDVAESIVKGCQVCMHLWGRYFQYFAYKKASSTDCCYSSAVHTILLCSSTPCWLDQRIATKMWTDRQMDGQ